MAVDDIWQGTLETEYQNNPNTYSWYFKAEQQANPPAAAADVLGEMDAILIALKPMMNTEVMVRCTTARRVAPNFTLPEIKIKNEEGLRSTAPGEFELPGQCALVVSLYGDPTNITKHNRGRDFINWGLTGDQNSGVWNGPGSPWWDGIKSAYVEIGNSFSGAVGNNWEIGIFSRTEFKAKKPVEEYFWQLQNIRLRQLVRTQRRRQAEDRCEVVEDVVIPAG